MPLTTGTRLGPYEILEPIGAGGMGEVYKANDTRLDRTVAIKVLPEHLAESPERKARFEREAKAISQLNHPHICTLYDVGEQDGIDFIVMEYIEGETLAERLKKGALKLDQALEYGIQIADGLDKAHRAGIVHRDLKPGNVMLAKSGVKLLDFGLARVLEKQTAAGLSEAQTKQKDLTKEQAIVGTLQYMAPEQLERKVADTRTDIFALGLVLHEMVTGKKAFEGQSQASLIGAILKDDPPPVSELAPISPPALDHVVTTCLAKDPDERWQSSSDVGRHLRWIGQADQQATTDRAKANAWPAWLTHVATGAVVALVSAIAVWSTRSPESAQPARFLIDSAPAEGFSLNNDPNVAISPDGSHIVFGGADGRLYFRSTNEFEASPLPETDSGHSPFFSPDGEWIGFFSDTDRTLRKLPTTGGQSISIAPAIDGHLGASWREQDEIVFSSLDNGLARVSAFGGVPERLTNPDEGTVHGFPDVLPGGGIVFTIRDARGGPENSRIAFLSPNATKPVIVVARGTGPRYADSGHLLYGDSGSILAVAFDPKRGQMLGSPKPVVPDVAATPDGPLVFTVSRNGTLLYLPDTGPFIPGGKLVWVDRDGDRERVVEDRSGYRHPRLSPDGRRVLAQLDGDIWTLDFERGTRSRVTFDEGAYGAIWVPDGERIVYQSGALGGSLFSKNADGSGQAEPFLEKQLARTNIAVHSWRPDSTVLAYYATGGTGGSTGGRDIWTLLLDGRAEPEPFVVTEFNERSPSFSPDGRWVAYVSDESGQDEIYIRSYPGSGRKVTVSTEGGREPVWCPAGGELFFRSGDRMMAVPIDTGEQLEVGAPYTLFERDYLEDASSTRGSQNYDVAPNCDQFLLVAKDAPNVTGLRVVLNWTQELKELVTTAN